MQAVIRDGRPAVLSPISPLRAHRAAFFRHGLLPLPPQWLQQAAEVVRTSGVGPAAQQYLLRLDLVLAATA